MAFKFKVNDRVVHAALGAAIVTALYDEEQGDIYTVLFDNAEFNTKENAEQLEGDLSPEGDDVVTELDELKPETTASETDPPAVSKTKKASKKKTSKAKAAPKAKAVKKAKAKFAKGDRVACSLNNDEKAKITKVIRLEDDSFQYEVNWENTEIKDANLVEEANLTRARPKHVSPKEKARLGDINAKRLSQLALARKNLAAKRAAEKANELVETSEAESEAKASHKGKKSEAA